MKTAKEIKPKTSAQKDIQKNTGTASDREELKTEPPLSEKDEVKQAEEKLREGK